MAEDYEESEEEHLLWAAFEAVGISVTDEIKAKVRGRLVASGLSMEEIALEMLGFTPDELRIRSELRARKKRNSFAVVDPS